MPCSSQPPDADRFGVEVNRFDLGDETEHIPAEFARRLEDVLIGGDVREFFAEDDQVYVTQFFDRRGDGVGINQAVVTPAIVLSQTRMA